MWGRGASARVSLRALIPLLLAVPSRSPGASIQLADQELADRASTMVVGTATSLASEWDAAQTRISTTVSVGVDYYIKGPDTSRTLQVTVLGGRVGDVIESVSDAPQLETGEQALLFLQPDGFPVVGGQQGELRTVDDWVMDRAVNIADLIWQVRQAGSGAGGDFGALAAPLAAARGQRLPARAAEPCHALGGQALSVRLCFAPDLRVTASQGRLHDRPWDPQQVEAQL
jgi:hypothetical protein